MAKIKAYAKGDWQRVRPRPLELEGLKHTEDLESYILEGPAFTIWENDHPAMCGGVRIRKNEPVGEAWLYCSDWIEKHIMVARLVRRMMSQIVKDFSLDYVEIIANTNYPKTLRWLGWLRFTVQRTVPGFPQYVIYRRVQWE